MLTSTIKCICVRNFIIEFLFLHHTIDEKVHFLGFFKVGTDEPLANSILENFIKTWDSADPSPGWD